MSEKPLVSVCCITYNHGPFIRQCLDGILMQTTNFSFEVLIHDDASTDETQAIIKEYQRKFPGIVKPMIQKENQYSKGLRGINVHFNFPRVSGKYIAMCEGDDYWTDPYKLQKQVDFLESNTQYSICVHHALKIDENQKESNFLVKTKSSNNDFNVEDVLSVNGQFAPTASYLFKKEVLLELPEWMIHAPAGDIILELYSLKPGMGKVIDETMSVYRRNHKQSWTRSIQSDKKKYIEFKEKQLRVLEYLKVDFPEVSPSVFAIKSSDYCYTLARVYLSDYEFEKFRHYISCYKRSGSERKTLMGEILFKVKDVKLLSFVSAFFLRLYLGKRYK